MCACSRTDLPMEICFAQTWTPGKTNENYSSILVALPMLTRKRQFWAEEHPLSHSCGSTASYNPVQSIMGGREDRVCA